MTSRVPCWCDYCLHYEGYGVCRAFPAGIPEAVLDGSHLTPVPGDGGIVFTLDPAKQSEFQGDRPYLPALPAH